MCDIFIMCFVLFLFVACFGCNFNAAVAAMAAAVLRYVCMAAAAALRLVCMVAAAAALR
jgi:hypothetical protein